MHPAIGVTLALAALSLVSCATGPRFDTAKYAASPSPRQVAEAPDEPPARSVLWGGIIINSSNLENGTVVEVLAYPLDSSQRPRTEEPAQGRFLVFEPRYLEPVDYAQGRLLTVAGTITGTHRGRVGETSYVYPRVEADRLFLWPKTERTARPRFNIGVGVIFSR